LISGGKLQKSKEKLRKSSIKNAPSDLLTNLP